METYGELKQAINAIKLKQKGTKIGNVAVDVALNVIPGIGAAKTTFDFIQAAFLKPDTKKTNSWLDKLDIDDEMSSIVDDTVENGFLQMMSKTIDAKSDTDPLESNFNMNDQMVDYLKKEYSGRTVSGVKENKSNTMKKSKLKSIIKENIINFLEQEDPTPDNDKQKVKIPSTVKPLVQKLTPDIDMASFTMALGKIAKGKESSLTLKEKNILTEIFISLMKSDDKTLIQKLATIFKQIK
tara:strand:+ start:115 stop:834 length:720 start_codon:yes stop_codon:yes gene_type:complete